MSGMRFSCPAPSGDRLPLPQPVIGIADDDPETIDEIGAQVLSLDRLGVNSARGEM